MNSTLPNVPIGTIVAFAGNIDTGWLASQGWLYCNGASLSKSNYADLFFEIGSNYGGSRTTFNLPDFRGQFARGVDQNSKNDPGVASRGAAGAGGLSGDNPGSVQLSMTSLPVTAFTAETAGEHTHEVPHAPDDNNAYAIAGSHYGIWNDDTRTTGSAGSHTHSIEQGGDQESRPINKYVFYIIKFADAE